MSLNMIEGRLEDGQSSNSHSQVTVVFQSLEQLFDVYGENVEKMLIDQNVTVLPKR